MNMKKIGLVGRLLAPFRRPPPPPPVHPPPPPASTNFALASQLVAILCLLVFLRAVQRYYVINFGSTRAHQFGRTRLTGQRVLIRVGSTWTMETLGDTVKLCLSLGAKSVLIAPFGGQRVDKGALRPNAATLAQRLRRSVSFLAGGSAHLAATWADPAVGRIILLDELPGTFQRCSIELDERGVVLKGAG